jgi:hypothetical protein
VRTISGPERALLAGRFAASLRVEVENADGDMVDLANLGGLNFVESAEWSKEIDIPVAGLTVGVRRQVNGVSLAPLVEGSTANQNEIAQYAPLLNGGRLIRISTACTLPGVAPVLGDWKAMFIGKVDDVDFARPVISLTCRDLGARLFDTFIEDVVACRGLRRTNRGRRSGAASRRRNGRDPVQYRGPGLTNNYNRRVSEFPDPPVSSGKDARG